MKNKSLIYILIPLVFLLWGLIFYKIFSKIDKQETVFKSLTNNRIKSIEELRDSFVLKANYRDPFLSLNSKILNNSNELDHLNTNVNKFSKSKFSKFNIVFPELKYFGLIINASSKKKIGLFQVNNRDVLLRENELYNEMKIVRFYNDSVKIMFHKICKIFKKN